MLQAHAPDSFEEAGTHPGLESPVAGASRTVLPRHHFPLATGSQDIENAVENRAVGHPGPTIGPRRLIGGKDGLDQVP